jgi:hypothetical protein
MAHVYNDSHAQFNKYLPTHAGRNSWNFNLVVETDIGHEYEVPIASMTRCEDYWVVTHH